MQAQSRRPTHPHMGAVGVAPPLAWVRCWRIAEAPGTSASHREQAGRPGVRRQNAPAMPSGVESGRRRPSAGFEPRAQSDCTKSFAPSSSGWVGAARARLKVKHMSRGCFGSGAGRANSICRAASFLAHPCRVGPALPPCSEFGSSLVRFWLKCSSYWPVVCVRLSLCGPPPAQMHRPGVSYKRCCLVGDTLSTSRAIRQWLRVLSLLYVGLPGGWTGGSLPIYGRRLAAQARAVSGVSVWLDRCGC